PLGAGEQALVHAGLAGARAGGALEEPDPRAGAGPAAGPRLRPHEARWAGSRPRAALAPAADRPRGPRRRRGPLAPRDVLPRRRRRRDERRRGATPLPVPGNAAPRLPPLVAPHPLHRLPRE